MNKKIKSSLEVLTEVSGLLPETIESHYKWVLVAMEVYHNQFQDEKAT